MAAGLRAVRATTFHERPYEVKDAVIKATKANFGWMR